ncbi:MAG: primase alpha helix C-terminal domain-containing protein, partial [Planctomycetota bacterium]
GLSPADVEPLDGPATLLARLSLDGLQEETDAPSRRGREHWDGVTTGTAEGGRNDAAASLAGKLLRGAADLEDEEYVGILRSLFEGWNETKNRPPLPPGELQTTFRSVARAERERRQRALLKDDPHAATAIAAAADDEVPDGYRLVRITSDPAQFKLYAPLFANGDRGFSDHVLVDTRTLDARPDLRRAIKEQAHVWPPTWFLDLLFGQPKPKKDATEIERHGLIKRLAESATFEEPAFEERRDLFVAAAVYERLSEVHEVEGIKPEDRLGPQRIMQGESAGCIWFRTAWLHGQISIEHRDVTVREISRCLKSIGIDERAVRIEGKPRRYKVATPKQIQQLETLAVGRLDDQEAPF